MNELRPLNYHCFVLLFLPLNQTPTMTAITASLLQLSSCCCYYRYYCCYCYYCCSFLSATAIAPDVSIAAAAITITTILYHYNCTSATVTFTATISAMKYCCYHILPLLLQLSLLLLLCLSLMIQPPALLLKLLQQLLQIDKLLNNRL